MNQADYPVRVMCRVLGLARELIGFLWAALRDVDVTQLQEVSAAA